MEDGSRTRVREIPRTGIHSGGQMIEVGIQKADKRVAGYLKERVYEGVVSGIFRGGGPYSHPTVYTVDRPKAIPRRVT